MYLGTPAAKIARKSSYLTSLILFLLSVYRRYRRLPSIADEKGRAMPYLSNGPLAWCTFNPPSAKSEIHNSKKLNIKLLQNIKCGFRDTGALIEAKVE